MNDIDPRRFKDYNSGRGSEAHLKALKREIGKNLNILVTQPKIMERLRYMSFDELEERADILCGSTITDEIRTELKLIQEIMFGVMETHNTAKNIKEDGPQSILHTADIGGILFSFFFIKTKNDVFWKTGDKKENEEEEEDMKRKEEE